ncbi:MAG: MurT ligase domain-containing protein [Eubacteriales bacterium]|nr:MurT ligase domain-containing protein [Eubacteriales bacterium]
MTFYSQIIYNISVETGRGCNKQTLQTGEVCGGCMDLKIKAAITVSRIVSAACRLIGHGGTSLPGKAALLLCPDIITKLSAGYRVIMVTGTNGKTTTAKIICRILECSGIPYITNKSGANLKSGIAATFALNSSALKAAAALPKGGTHIKGNNPPKVSSPVTAQVYAVLETDEAALSIVSPLIKPEILVVTNFFRDQLDRYGELNTLISGVARAIGQIRETRLVLNADDSLCASLAKDVPNEKIFFGFSPEAAAVVSDSSRTILSDASYCMYCKNKYSYSFTTYAHLGGFSCPVCGYARPVPNVCCKSVVSRAQDHTSAVFTTGNCDGGVTSSYNVRINLPGTYNIYNALAAFSCSQSLSLPADHAVEALGSFKSGFGRMETVRAGNKTIQMILVKNPTGFNQVLEHMASSAEELSACCFAIVINDRIADGTDISWLWDVRFEDLHSNLPEKTMILVSGIRSAEMAVRLKYAGFPPSDIVVEDDYAALIEKGLAGTEDDGVFYLLPTYTAMLDLRKILARKYKLGKYWH